MTMTRFAPLAALVLALAAPAAGADPALECSLGASSQVETGACVAATLERAEAAMAVALQAAAAAAEELDAITGRAVSRPALEAAQAAWLAWRDAHCDYVGSTFGGGSGTGIGITACRVDLTRERTAALFAALG